MTTSKTKSGRVLVLAGSDSSGGAGIQADIKTITALGGYAMTAITALTAQNTKGVDDIAPASPTFVRAQALACLSDIGADAIKTGMLGDKTMVETVAQLIVDHANDKPRVIDPVMVATSGAQLLTRDAVDAVRSELVPHAVVTPNAHEAELLTGKEVADINGQRRAAERLLEANASAAIVKGGHVDGDVITDVLATPDGEVFIEHARIASTNTHGTGCSLASALACSLAQDMDLEPALRRAIAYISEAIRCAPGFGAGSGPLDHAWPMKDPETANSLGLFETS